LDGMVGYDPEDPVTALGVGKVEGSYTRYLDQGALNGARIGILRESIGNQSDPNAPDFKIVDAAFEKNVAPNLRPRARSLSIRSLSRISKSSLPRGSVTRSKPTPRLNSILRAIRIRHSRRARTSSARPKSTRVFRRRMSRATRRPRRPSTRRATSNMFAPATS